MPSIVSITSKTLIQSGYYGPFSSGKTQEQYAEGAGSGIIIGTTGSEILILTNNHVVADSKELTVKFIDDKEVDATIKGTSERKDVAVIVVNAKNLDSDTLNEIKVATLGDSNELKVGNGIIAIGNALGYGQSVTTGVVSALDREIEIGYIITEIDGKTVKSVNTIQDVLYDKKKGDSITLKVKYPKGREYSEKEIKIEF